MAERIGVYICRCGGNVTETVDVDSLVAKYAADGRVAACEGHDLLCAPAGREFLAGEIKSKKLDKLVIAACSPREHEKTFRKVCDGVGMNPYLFHMSNIREQCAWVHNDKAEATEKADRLIEGGVRRMPFMKPLESRQIDCSADTLIIGAGPAGITAALTLAEAGRKVYLLDRQPSPGGLLLKYEKAAPTFECCPCMMAPKMSAVGENPNITLLANSDVEDIVGFYGNYTVKVTKRARYVDTAACMGCVEVCSEPCPVSVPKEYDERLGMRKAIYTIFPGAVPNAPVIDMKTCVRAKGENCTKCAEACPFGAVVYDQVDEHLTLSVGAVIISTGTELYDAAKIPNLGYGRVPDVYTSLEFERLGSTTGCTAGKIVKKDGTQPKKIGILHCVGSLDKRYNEYCSQICCEYAMKFGVLAKEGMPEVEVVNFYKELTLAGKAYETMAKRTVHEGTKLVRVDNPNDVKVGQNGAGIKVEYTQSGAAKSETVDMLVLCPALRPASGTDEFVKMLTLKTSADGFLAEENVNMATTATTTDGIFIAGAARGPCGVAAATTQAQAAAGQVLAKLQPGKKLDVEVITAILDEEICSGCKTCIVMCPYKAISFDEGKKHAVLNEVLCRACGTCVASCPSGALDGKFFTREAVLAEMGGVL